MANLSGVKVGDVLWMAQQNNARSSYAIAVNKVGKKFAYFGVRPSDRFEIATGRWVCSMTGSLDGQVWSSKEACDLETARVEAWRSLCKDVHQAWKPPEDVNIEAIQQARTLLGLDQA
jgi:hypothetical protein